MNKRKYFSDFKKKIDYFIDVQPLPVKPIYFNYGVFIKYVDNIEESWDVNFDIPIPEYVENVIEPALYPFFPSFIKVLEKEVNLLPGTIKRMMRDNIKLNISDLVSMKEKIQYKIPYVIERVHSRDKRLIVNTGFNRFIYNYPDCGSKDMKKFITNISSEELSDFVLNSCSYGGEYKRSFKINVRYKDEQMINFFRFNKEKVEEPILFNNDKDLWEWGRYNIYFNKEEVKDICIDILNV